MTVKLVSWIDFVSGILSGLVGLTFLIASISLILPGNLAVYLPLGVACILIGVIVGGSIIALKTPSPFSISFTTTPIAALIGGMLVKISEQIPATVNAYPTLFISIILVTFMISIITYLMGKFRLTYFTGYIPYPVLGGFILGTAWIILKSALTLFSFSRNDITPFMFPIVDLVIQYLPGILFGVLLFYLAKYFKNNLVIPLVVVLATLSVHGFFWISHIPYENAILEWRGFSAFNYSSALPVLKSYTINDISWIAIFKESGYLVSIIFIAIFMLTFGLNTLEIETKQRMQIDGQLKTAGIANMISGFLGGAVSLLSVSSTLTNYNSGAKTRASSLIACFFCGAVLLFSQYILIYIPKVVIGSLLVYQSLNLFNEWLVKSWKRLPLLDYLTLIVILMVIFFKGIVLGIIVGAIIASFLFIYDYSHIPIVKYILSGETQQSHHKYSPAKESILYEKEKQLYVFKLQGYIFFGSARKLLDAVERIICNEAINKLRFIILDFQQVTGIDSSAGFNFAKIKNRIDENNLSLIFSQIAPSMTNLLEGFSLNANGASIQIFPMLDLAIEFCEAKFLEESISPENSVEKNFDVFEHFFSHRKNLKLFLNYLTKLEFPKGKILFHQNDVSDCLYFIVSGKVSTYLELPDKSQLRVYTSEFGTIVGEMGFFTQLDRSATVVTDEASMIYKLTQESFSRLLQESPIVGLEFYKGIICLLSERLGHADRELALLNLNFSQ
jgi:SulP family sulfate permease